MSKQAVPPTHPNQVSSAAIVPTDGESNKITLKLAKAATVSRQLCQTIAAEFEKNTWTKGRVGAVLRPSDVIRRHTVKLLFVIKMLSRSLSNEAPAAK